MGEYVALLRNEMAMWVAGEMFGINSAGGRWGMAGRLLKRLPAFSLCMCVKCGEEIGWARKSLMSAAKAVPDTQKRILDTALAQMTGKALVFWAVMGVELASEASGQ